jgi:hypothetical protein
MRAGRASLGETGLNCRILLHIPLYFRTAEAMYKQNFEEILENVQTQILEHFDVAEDEFEAATECYKDDSEVSGMVHQLEALYRGDSGAPGEKDAVPDVGAEELERIIKTDFGEAWCSAFEKTARDFQAQGKDMTEADQELLLEFHTQASGHAQDNLAEVSGPND